MHVRSLQMTNLRCFRSAQLAFQYPGRPDGSSTAPNINLVLGNNGAGKTSILRAIALATLSPVIVSSGFVPYRLVRATPSETPASAQVDAEITLHSQDVGGTPDDLALEESVHAEILRRGSIEQVMTPPTPQPHWEGMFDDGSPAFLIVGYGAGRQVESTSSIDTALRRKSRLLRYERVAGLFEDGVTLTPLGAWLPSFQTSNPDRYGEVVETINLLLPDECRFHGGMEGTDYLFQLRGVPVPFGALSDGYRAYIGWTADLLYHVCTGASSDTRLADIRGIVLVDEIDLHLHPEWQRTVIPRIAAALPRLQFVLTTHSPIVAGTLASANIFVVENDESGASTVRQLEERIHGLSAEQILLSSYFQLETTRAPGVEVELSALARQARGGDPQAAIDYLNKLTQGSDSEDEEMAIS